MNNKRIRLPLKLLTLAAVLAVAAFAVLDAFFPFPWERLTPAPSLVVLDSRDQPMRVFLAPDQSWRMPVALDEVAPVFLAAVLSSEDRHFYEHPGVNPVSVLGAAVDNLSAGRVVRGGSTITMQTARMAEPKPRTVASKAVECFRAVQLELGLSKDDILDRYVNMAPFGGNIVGVGAASWFYFGKPPSMLSLSEAALLAAIPRSPNRLSPIRHPGAAMRVRRLVLDAMVENGAVSAAQADEAASQPLPERLTRPPLVAPHLAHMAKERLKLQGGDPARIRTTLDSRVHELARQAMRSRMTALRSQGIENAAVVVIDVKTRRVLSLAGSADFLDDARHGRVNAAVARRSPGSALKPFLYAEAFQEGLIAPESLLLDIPVQVNGYDPHNYDGVFRGRVEVADALVHSLNAPAVRLLQEVGQERFVSLLNQGGLGLSKPAAHYGLSLILGGGEVTLLDLTNLYATLARGGMHGPALTGPDQALRESRLFSPEACALTTDILSRLERPDLPGGIERARGVPAVAWKTGTSFGHRDAWAVGFSARYAVGVWTGNVTGRAVKGISGARQAAPLLFDVFRALEPDGAGLPQDVRQPGGLNLAEVEVCALSRQLPGPDCRHTVKLTIIPGVTRLARCEVHRRVLVDASTGLRVAGSCLEGREVRQEVVTEFPAELTAWWRMGGMPVPPVPGPDPGCRDALAGQGPRITSPRDGAAYRLRAESPDRFQRVGLAAQAGADAGELAWFQDGRLVARLHPGEQSFLGLSPGSHRLVVVDSQGRSDGVTYLVE